MGSWIPPSSLMSTKLTASANIAIYNNNDSPYSGLDRRGPITNASSIELQIVGEWLIFLKGAIEVAKEIIEEEISNKLDTEKLSSSSTNIIRIADFGCSTGPYTFHAMQIIVETIKKKIEKQLSVSHQMPEFQVFFNDRTSNDFNTLFASLPQKKQYYAAGVPGSFHDCQFPKASLHFAYSSFTLHWLSEVPKEVVDPLSPAWNKGKILYHGDKNEVFNAYAAQFAKDLDSFLKARAHELVFGGLMTLLVCSKPNHTKNISNIHFQSLELLGSCLMDLAKEGLFDTAKVDSFNMPMYFPTHNELIALIEKKNQDFSIERMEMLNYPPKRFTTQDSKSFAMFVRALIEGFLQAHFGSSIMDDLCGGYEQKVELSKLLSNPDENSTMTFVLLKCKWMT
ncbi:probable S-adenosylmethionine-dependent methyltransferase At5g37970 [Olea europaea var. sylvestris]|uniref:probable S-adenosylmethionine-dependent methyltransferase At5g37970 n=1 Tax=Olea europaea var. sylvestris TaxID=158386 RepID=UPI000C1D0245|nr:probable S-adenosylmethionine-dependent methyltransferase At5g37970 [Olea europaea var. sylvestris]